MKIEIIFVWLCFNFEVRVWKVENKQDLNLFIYVFENQSIEHHFLFCTGKMPLLFLLNAFVFNNISPFTFLHLHIHRANETSLMKKAATFEIYLNRNYNIHTYSLQHLIPILSSPAFPSALTKQLQNGKMCIWIRSKTTPFTTLMEGCDFVYPRSSLHPSPITCTIHVTAAISYNRYMQECYRNKLVICRY